MFKKEKNDNLTRKTTLRKIKKQVKGITLIALVVTIIVLLILAGIALNLTIGENGLFTRAQNAANTWQLAEQNEQNAMNNLASWMDSVTGSGNGQGTGGEYNTATTVADAVHQNKFFKENTTIKDDLQNDVRVPEGFKIAEDSGTKVEEGVVIEDKDGNQFVWIPAKTGAGVTVHTTKGDKTIAYTRTAYSSNVATGEMDEATNSEKIKDFSSDSSFFSEALSTDEETSVNANGGYYIGRFEAGNKEFTDAKTSDFNVYMENRLMDYAKEIGIDINNPDNITDEQMQKINEKMEELYNEKYTITIKKGQVPYMYTSIDEAKKLAEEMSILQGYKAKTNVTSSYAFDTAINLIQITNEDYGNSSIEGNYDNTTFIYTDITGVEKTKNDQISILVPTGQTMAVCNIYDIGGNLWEYTTESYTFASYPYTLRGGCYFDDYAFHSAGYRYTTYTGEAAADAGFRVTLFL